MLEDLILGVTVFSKVRKCMRYMLGNLYDFDPSKDLLPYDSLLPQDQYMLHLLYEFGQQVECFRRNAMHLWSSSSDLLISVGNWLSLSWKRTRISLLQSSRGVGGGVRVGIVEIPSDASSFREVYCGQIPCLMIFIIIDFVMTSEGKGCGQTGHMVWSFIKC